MLPANETTKAQKAECRLLELRFGRCQPLIQGQLWHLACGPSRTRTLRVSGKENIGRGKYPGNPEIDQKRK